MKFEYSRHNLGKNEGRLERGLEILPAVLSWSLLISFTLVCILAPVAGVVTVILFDLYWLFRLVYFTIFLVLSYVLLEIERTAPWFDRLQDLLYLEGAVTRTQKRVRDPKLGWKIHFSEKRHLATLKRLQHDKIHFPNPKDIYHLVIIPYLWEDLSVLEPTLEALRQTNYPKNHIVVVLAIEERGGKEAVRAAEVLKEEYAKDFLHFENCIHPDGLPGEAAVKGANVTYAARWAKKFFEARETPLDHIVVSCFDSDTVVSTEYFSCLTYNYLIHPKRTRTSFQPIPVYHNNLWEAPSFARVLETGSSYFQLIEVTDPDHLVTFSSHSMSFQALVEVGYWPVDLVSDDSAIFWKAFLIFNGDYRVEPLYVTLSMDVAIGENVWKTCQSIYRQKRRWAWGVENFPILVRGMLKNREIPFWLKFKRALRLLEMNVSWATWTPIMMILSWAPALVPNYEFNLTVAHFNAPRVAGVICNMAIASLVISIILSFYLLPKRPKKVPFYENIFLALQWLLVPAIATIFGAIPALDAQTRLALGQYMEFFVAPKGGKNKKRGVARGY